MWPHPYTTLYTRSYCKLSIFYVQGVWPELLYPLHHALWDTVRYILRTRSVTSPLTSRFMSYCKLYFTYKECDLTPTPRFITWPLHHALWATVSYISRTRSVTSPLHHALLSYCKLSISRTRSVTSPLHHALLATVSCLLRTRSVTSPLHHALLATVSYILRTRSVTSPLHHALWATVSCLTNKECDIHFTNLNPFHCQLCMRWGLLDDPFRADIDKLSLIRMPGLERGYECGLKTTNCNFSLNINLMTSWRIIL